MRIVQIEDFFHPNAGYQVNILSKYFSKAGHDVTIVTAELEKLPEYLTGFFGKNNIEQDDANYEKNYGVKIIRIPVKKYISGRVVYSRKIFKTVDSLKPDILYVHGNDTLIAIQYLMKLRKLKYPIITDSHMLEIASQNRFSRYFRFFYKHIVTPQIVKNKISVIRTQLDDYVQKCLGIPLEICPCITFGSDTMLFHQDELVRAKFRKELGISEEDFVVVYAGKLDEAKGGQLMAEAIVKRITNLRNTIFIIIGNTIGEFGQEVEETFKKSENLVLRFPSQNYVDLPQYYQMADIAIFARQCSLSFYDVQACGLPVVTENNNINVERCSNGNGLCFISGDKDDLFLKIKTFVEMPQDEFKKYRSNSVKYIMEGYDYKKKADEYLQIIRSVYNEYHRTN